MCPELVAYCRYHVGIASPIEPAQQVEGPERGREDSRGITTLGLGRG